MIDPYGTVTHTNGAAQSAYGFTGEMADVSGLTYLRARYYSPLDGRFMSRDTWEGNQNGPLSFNKWSYTSGNPVNRTDRSGKCWYGDVTTGEIKTEPLLEGSGPCSFFVDAMKSIGVSVTTPSKWLSSLPESIRSQIICQNQNLPSLNNIDGYWMVIKYSTSSGWKYYATTNTNFEAKAVFGIGGDAGYSCENSTKECSLTTGIAAGSVMLSVGLGAEYNFKDEDFEMGATVEVGPCATFLNYSEISFTCKALDFDVVNHEFEFGWKRNPYEVYWVLAHSTQTHAAGGIDEFGKKVLAKVPRVHPELGLTNYEIIEVSSNRWDLEHKFKINLRLPLIEL